MRIGHLKEVTLTDLTNFAAVCVYIVLMALGKVLWLPKTLIVWALKELGWLAACLAGVWAVFKLFNWLFCHWFGIEEN